MAQAYESSSLEEHNFLVRTGSVFQIYYLFMPPFVGVYVGLPSCNFDELIHN